MEKHQKGQKVRDKRDRWRHEIYPKRFSDADKSLFRLRTTTKLSLSMFVSNKNKNHIVLEGAWKAPDKP